MGQLDPPTARKTLPRVVSAGIRIVAREPHLPEACTMEPIGFAFGVLGPLESLVRDLKQRYKNYKEAPGKHEEICARLQSCHESLSSMQNMFEQGWPLGFPETSKEICKNNCSRIRDLTNSCSKQLEDLHDTQFSVGGTTGCWKRISLKATRTSRTNRVMEVLQQLDTDSREIESFTQGISDVLGLAYQAANLAQNSASEMEAFRIEFNVPRPSDFLLFDFSSTATPEGRLRRLLLADTGTSGKVSAAVGGGRPVSVPGVLDMGGVGKTSALMGLGYDHDIRKHFFDGVHFLSFGQQAGPAEVIAGVAGLVRDSGGHQSAKNVASCSKLVEAVHKAASWFSGRTCLFLCDDLWRADGRPHGFLPDIRKLLDKSASSKMVFSTRDHSIAEETSHQVVFGAMETQGEQALAMFLSYAGLMVLEVKSCDDTSVTLSREILTICGGLPIALAVAGRLLRRYLRLSSNDRVNALEGCLRDLRKGTTKIGDTSVGTYSSFNATIRASLDFLEKEEKGGLGRASSSAVGEEKTISYLFEAFCVMKKQARLPISILQRLWDLSHYESHRVVNFLVDLNIIAEHSDGQDASSISAHDLVLAYSRDLAERSGREEMWHTKLLNSYVDLRPEADMADHPVENSSVSFLNSPRPWWDVESDGYIHKNISWHLKNGGLARELGGLVTDMRWTKHRLNQGGLLELENDIDVLLTTLTNNDDAVGEKHVPQEVSKDFRTLRKALRLSWPWMHKNPRELGFQVYSRLCHRKDSSEIINKYLKSVEMWNEKPWLRPWHSAEADGRLVTEIGTEARAPAWSTDEKRILYAVGEGDLVVFNVDRNEEESRDSFEHRIVSMSVAGMGRLVALGSGDGSVYRWDLEINSQVGETLTGHSDSVKSVAMSGDGRILISGSREKTVRLWQFDGEDNVIRTRRKKFRDIVRAVSISENGKRAASASGNTVTVWNTPGLRKVCKLRGHSRRVMCIAMSADGRHLVSGSYDGFVRLWNLEGNQRTGHPLFEYSDKVSGVSMSRDGRRVAAGFLGGSARVWEMSTRKQIGPKFDAGKWHDTDVALNGDGSRVILSASRSVSVWDVSEDVDEWDRAGGHSYGVASVAYSHETNRIASVSWDRTLRLWDADTGLAVGDPLLSVVPRFALPEILAMSGNGKKVAVSYVSYRVGYVRVWDVHERKEMGKIETGPSRGLWISRDGKYVVSKSDDGKVRIWNVSTLAEIVSPWAESLCALESATNTISKVDDERGLIVLRPGALNEMTGSQCTNRVESMPSHSTSRKLKIDNRRDIVLMNHDKGELVLGSLSESIFAWSVYQNARGENILVAGGTSGKMHWFTLEVE